MCSRLLRRTAQGPFGDLAALLAGQLGPQRQLERLFLAVVHTRQRNDLNARRIPHSMPASVPASVRIPIAPGQPEKTSPEHTTAPGRCHSRLPAIGPA